MSFAAVTLNKHGQQGGEDTTYSDAALQAQLLRLQRAWRRSQGNRDRGAIYGFLDTIFSTVAVWRVDQREVKRTRRILRQAGAALPDIIEPFAGLIVAAAYPTTIDRRTVSKWSRALRFVAEDKRPDQALQPFMMRSGGINGCAAQFTRRLGRSR
jgi:hypothetical protein